METATVERKWALVKVRSGDWLLPSNDRKTLWRIKSYVDGPSMGLVDWPRDLTLWGCYRWDGPFVPEVIEQAFRQEEWDGMDYNRWERVGDHYTTRREAIDAALTMT